MSDWPVTIVVPMEPPSGNHYKKLRVVGRNVSWYLTKDAKAWHHAVAVCCAAVDQVDGKAHEIEYTVFQGAGSRGDVDNYAKVVLDALVRASVLRSDASVVALHCYKRRDRENPRTEIRIRSKNNP